MDPCSLRAAAALSPTLGWCDIGTPRAQPKLAVLSPSHSSEQSLLLRNLGALRLAAREGELDWLWEPGCSHLGKEKDSGKQ